MRAPARGRVFVGGAPAATTLAVVVVAALGGGCSQQPIFLPSHDLDRPTDVAFSCIAIQSTPGSDTTVVGGQPMDACHPPGTKDPLFGQADANGTQYKTFAFLPNSARGDVSVIDMSYCRSNDDSCRQHALQPGAALVDLDPNTIGYGSVPVGELPEVIAASQDGCRLVTANRGSCDLTLLDPAALLTPHLAGQALGTYGKTFMVRTGMGRPLPVAPGEIAFVPQQTNVAGEGRGPAQLCDATGTLAAPVGMPPATPQARASWHAIVTFPSCDLIALVDLQTEKILDSYRVRPRLKTEGDSAQDDSPDVPFFHTGSEPVCPRIDCGAGAGTSTDAGTTVTQPVTDDAGAGGAGGGAAPSGAAGDTGAGGSAPGGAGGGAAGGAAGSSTGGGGSSVVTLDDTAPAFQVGPIAIRPEGKRVYFGATNWPAVGALDIAGQTLAVPSEGRVTPLYDTKGITRLRLSVDPYAYVNGHLPKPASGPDANDPTLPELGRFVARTDSANLQYLYAIARDASLRILDVSRSDPKECDLGIDPSAVPETDPRRKCFPFGASDNPPRLPQAIYRPGLRFPSAPQDVAFAYYWTQPSALASDQAVNEQILNGAFGFVLTGGGGLFILNVDPEPRLTAKVYYVVTDADSTQHVLDIQPEANPGLPPVAGLRVESPLPLPNSQRDPNVITYSQSLQPSAGPARPDPSTLFTSNGPLLKSFSATTTRENATIIPLLSNGMWTPPPTSASTATATFIFFPNPVTVVPQTWTIVWEPDITGTRNSGDIDRSRRPKTDPSGLAFALSDYGGSFCTNGVFPGDIVTLAGCMTDSNCGPGRICVHSTEAPASASGYPINGLCMKRASAGDADVMRRCAPLLRSFRRYEIQPTTMDFVDAFKDQSTPQSTLVLLPKKAELPVVGECGAMCPPVDRRGAGIANFACEPDGVNKDRCLLRCDGDGGVPDDRKCATVRTGSVCVDFRATEGHFYCSDGASLRDGADELDDACGLDQLVSYSISAGRSFVVSGTAVGRTDPGLVGEVRDPNTGGAGGAAGGAGGAGGSSGDPATRYYQCVPDHSSPGVVARIPIDLPRCASPKITTFKQAVTLPGEKAYLEPTDGAMKAVFTDSTVPTPNPCLIEYGTATYPQDGSGAGGAGDATAGAGGAGGATGGALTAGPTYSALFQNREIRFVLTNLETTTGDTVQLRVGVNGGSVGQQIPVAADSAIGLAARVVVGPVPATDQTMDPPVPMPPDGAAYLPSELPFLFVIDQRTSAAGRLASRGQILRVAPRIADTAPIPGYQSAQTSNSYFPIQ